MKQMKEASTTNQRHKKKLAAVLAVIMLLSLLMSATFAWFSSLGAVNKFRNEGSDKAVVLHDDFFEGPIKNVYVENTSASSDIFVRIRLQEFMDLTSWADRNPTDWTTHIPMVAVNDCGFANSLLDKFHDNFTWQMEGNTWYVPSAEGMTGTVNDLSVTSETPGALQTQDAAVITMNAYLEMTPDARLAFVGWVYDADGWAYWSQKLPAGSATGLLLHQVIADISLEETDYFYAINVIMEAVDLSDLAMWTVASGNHDGFGQVSVTDPTKSYELGTNNAANLLNSISKTKSDISSIAIAKMPDKTAYAPGETFDPTGMEIKITHTDGSTDIIDTGYTYSPLGALTEDTVSVTVIYGDFTVEVPVSVSMLVGLIGAVPGTTVIINDVQWEVVKTSAIGNDELALITTSKNVEKTPFAIFGSNDYQSSVLRLVLTGYYTNAIVASPILANAVVIPEIELRSVDGMQDIFFLPTTQLAKDSTQTEDIVFALGYSETFGWNLANGETWWISTPNTSSQDAYYITATGALDKAGPGTQSIGYRPAMWIKCN
jgi:hypothetical protein